MDPLRNEKDPLRKAGPMQQQELFRRFHRGGKRLFDGGRDRRLYEFAG